MMFVWKLRGNNQNCSALFVFDSCAQWYAHVWADLKFDYWLGLDFIFCIFVTLCRFDLLCDFPVCLEVLYCVFFVLISKSHNMSKWHIAMGCKTSTHSFNHLATTGATTLWNTWNAFPTTLENLQTKHYFGPSNFFESHFSMRSCVTSEAFHLVMCRLAQPRGSQRKLLDFRGREMDTEKMVKNGRGNNLWESEKGGRKKGKGIDSHPRMVPTNFLAVMVETVLDRDVTIGH